jgi:hypothetical protein
MDLYLTLDEIGTSGLGEIPSGPFNYANLVKQVQYHKNTKLIEISLIGLAPDITPIEFVVSVFE